MSSTYSNDEFMVVVLARELSGCRHICIGTAAALHGAAALLTAQLSANPVRVTMLGGEERIFSDGMREMFDAAAQGRIDGFVLGGGQIDGSANVNFLGRGTYPVLDVRWPGNFGSPILYSTVRRVVLFRQEHSLRVFVKAVDFISAPGPTKAETKARPAALVTGLCIFDFDNACGQFNLKSIHPGHSLDEIRSKTGFDFLVGDKLVVTPAPTSVELDALRGVIVAKISAVYPRFAKGLSGKTDVLR